MNGVFIKRKIIHDSVLEDLRFDIPNLTECRSGISGGKNEPSVDTKVRSSISKRINVRWYVDYCASIEKFCNEFNPNIPSSSLVVKELEYLKYGISDHFKKHTDVIYDNQRPRRFSTVTMLSKTDDMEGGDLLLFDKNGDKYNASLEVGETIVFYSKTWHKVTPITRGGREVLVSWVYDRI